MSQEPLMAQASYKLTKDELQRMVKFALMHKRASIPEQISSFQDFFTALQTNCEDGLSDEQVKVNIKQFGRNQVSKKLRLPCKCSFMPFFYVFLVAIIAGVTCADKFLYGYDYWYVQGATMAVMAIITGFVFGCGRVRTSKREIHAAESEHEKQIEATAKQHVVVTRNGIQLQLSVDQLCVGDKVQLEVGEIAPCDCIVYQTGTELSVDESMIRGEPVVHKKSIGHYNSMNIDEETVIFSQSKVIEGSCFAIVLAVGDQSSLANKSVALDNEIDAEDNSDLMDKANNIVIILVCVLVFASGILLVQCGISKEIDWQTAGNIACMIFVYGFPYILAIPSVWDIAIRNTSKHLLDGNVLVQNLDSISEVASIDYLVLQSISVLDKANSSEEAKRKNRIAIAKLQAMGIKIIIATGVTEEEARQTAIECGVLRKEHEHICGAVIEGAHLRRIIQGRESGLGYDITPEYLSVIYRARPEEREALVDYLAKVHPGRVNSSTSYGFSPEMLKGAPVATVGVVGSGENDIKMIKKAHVAFSTSKSATQGAKDAADMILLADSLDDVVMAVTKGRSYKDHLMKFLALQIPASVAAIALVLGQVFLYDTILVTASFVFLINLIYFPIGIVCICRENPSVRWGDMIARWRSNQYPGSKTMSTYMRAENIKYSLFSLILFQIGALATLYFQADHLVSLIHEDLNWHKDDPLYVDKAYLKEHGELADGHEVFDLTDKGKLFLILFQTFAYMQIWNILNARRPSFRDLNPFSGISFLTVAVIILLLGFQFSIAQVPLMLGYGTIPLYTNLLCMGIGACGVVWFVSTKAFLKYISLDDDKAL